MKNLLHYKNRNYIKKDEIPFIKTGVINDSIILDNIIIIDPNINEKR